MDACIDTNIIGHLYRSNTQFLIDNIFDTVYVDEHICFELNRRCSDIQHVFTSDMKNPASVYQEITKENLLERKIYSLYSSQLKNLTDLFLPSDEGEKRAIALAKSTGTFFLLTDDEKFMTGPTYMIDQGIVPGMGCLAFWDLIFLNYLLGILPFNKCIETYEFICSDGYYPDKYKGNFSSKMKQAIRKCVSAEWFRDWCLMHNISTLEIKEFNHKLKSL